MRIETGKYSAGEFHELWTLGESGVSRKRTFSDEINFPRPFASPPKVMIAISGLDIIDEGAESRKSFDVQATRITTKGFTIQFAAYGDSRVMGLTVDWLAVGT
jgi:hypothetical protein